MIVSPSSRLSTTNSTVAGLEVVIPAKRSISLALFLGVWLLGWAAGEITVILQLISGKVSDSGGFFFLCVWLAFWTYAGWGMIRSWAWMLKGQEIVLLKPNLLSIKRDILGFGKPHEYELQHIKNIRVAPTIATPYDWHASMNWGQARGSVAFDYGAKTIRFAESIDEAEAAQIISELKSRNNFASAE